MPKRLKVILYLVLVFFLASNIQNLFAEYKVPGMHVDATDGLGKDDWFVSIDGHLIPASDSTVMIGSTLSQVTNIHADAITLGTIEKTGWGDVISPMTDHSGYVTPTDAGDNLQLEDDGELLIGGGNAADCGIKWDGNAVDFYIGEDDDTDTLIIGTSTTVGSNVLLTFSNDRPEIAVGFGTATDTAIKFRTGTTDFFIGADESAQEFVIATGTNIGSTSLRQMTVSTGGTVSARQGFDMIGAVGMDYGSADVTDHTFTADSTGDTEIVLPNDSIGDAEIDWSGLTTSHALIIGADTLTIGDGSAEDVQLVFDDDTRDFCIGIDTSGTWADHLQFRDGATIDAGTLAIAIATDENVTFMEDVEILDNKELEFGSNNDWQIFYDESVRDQLILTTATTSCVQTTDSMVLLLVGAGLRADQEVFSIATGTQIAHKDLFSVDSGGDVFVERDVLADGNVTASSGTVTVGSPANSDPVLLLNSDSIDRYIAVDVTNDSFYIGSGNTVATTPYMEIATTGRVTLSYDLEIEGTTPAIYIGDGGAEDTQVNFLGSAYSRYIGLDESDDAFVIGSGTTVGTNPILSIATTGRVTVQEPLWVLNQGLVATIERVVPFTIGDFVIASGDGVEMYVLDKVNVSTPCLAMASAGAYVPVIRWYDGAATPVAVTFKVPMDYDSGGAFRGFFGSDGTTASGPRVDYKVFVNSYAAAWDTDWTNQSHVELEQGASMTPDMVELSVTTDFDALATDNFITLNVWRDDTHAAIDTNLLEMFYLEFYYTASQ